MERGIDLASVVHCHVEGVRDTIIVQCFQALGEADIIFFWRLMHSPISILFWMLVSGGLLGKVKRVIMMRNGHLWGFILVENV